MADYDYGNTTMAHTNAFSATPWLGLGNEVTHDAPVETWLEESGLTWRAEKTPVYYAPKGEPRRSDRHFVLYRDDTNEALGVVSDRYQPVQPRAVLEFFRDLAKHGDLKIDMAGALKGGAIVWALAKSERGIEIKGDGETRSYALLSTSFDGSQSTRGSFLSMRMKCLNMLAMASRRAASDVVTMRHSTAFDARSMQEQMGLVENISADFEQHMNRLATMSISDLESVAVLRHLVGKKKNGGEELTQQSEKQIEAIYRAAKQSPGSDSPAAKGTAYGLLQGITYHVDHQARARSADNRLTSSWFGAGARLKSEAATLLLELEESAGGDMSFEARLDQEMPLRSASDIAT